MATVVDHIDMTRIPQPAVILSRLAIRGAETVRKAWFALAQAADAPKQYLEGLADKARIEVREASFDGDVATVLVVVVCGWEHSGKVDAGRERYHLPDAIHWPTARTKVGKDGQMWLNIPIRHKTKGMPHAVMRAARQLALTVGGQEGLQYHSDGRYRAADRYYVVGKGPVRLGTIGKYSGMIRTPAVRGRGSSYLTIRRMTPQSTGWWMPRKDGLKLPAQVAKIIPELLRELM